MVHLGFAFYDEHGQCIIPEEQLPNILNFDETCLSTDGSEGRRGGASGDRPSRSKVSDDWEGDEQR